MPENPPSGFHSLTPYLFVRNAAEAIQFYHAAFDAVETMRLPMPDGSVAHAEIQIGDSMLMLSEESPTSGAPSPQTLGAPTGAILLYVPDVDASFRQAVAAGAEVFMPAEDMFWGDRMGAITDPFGHRWNLATHLEDVSEEELSRRMAAFSSGQDTAPDNTP